MRKIIIFLAFIQVIVLSKSSFGQGPLKKNVYTYTYDNAGNRIMRRWVQLMCPNCRNANKDSIQLTDSLYAIAQNLEIKLPPIPTEELLYNGTPELRNVYPNPTLGNFIVQFTSLIVGTSFQIYDIQGNKLDEIILDGVEFQLDISVFPSGEYLLLIQTNDGRKYSKKIIKI